MLQTIQFHWSNWRDKPLKRVKRKQTRKCLHASSLNTNCDMKGLTIDKVL
jgi:hypothetical protein